MKPLAARATASTCSSISTGQTRGRAAARSDAPPPPPRASHPRPRGCHGRARLRGDTRPRTRQVRHRLRRLPRRRQSGAARQVVVQPLARAADEQTAAVHLPARGRTRRGAVHGRERHQRLSPLERVLAAVVVLRRPPRRPAVVAARATPGPRVALGRRDRVLAVARARRDRLRPGRHRIDGDVLLRLRAREAALAARVDGRDRNRGEADPRFVHSLLVVQRTAPRRGRRDWHRDCVFAHRLRIPAERLPRVLDLRRVQQQPGRRQLVLQQPVAQRHAATDVGRQPERVATSYSRS